MPGPIVLTKQVITQMTEEVAKRLGDSDPVEMSWNKIRAEEVLEKTAPEELIVRGVVASLKQSKKNSLKRR